MAIIDEDHIYGFSAGLLAAKYDNPKPIPPFHDEMWKLCCSDTSKVAIAAPREHAKSTAITHAYLLAMVVLYYSYLTPRDRLLSSLGTLNQS
jgi:hypothetical protein